MTIDDEKQTYDLNDSYSIRFDTKVDQQLNIELYQNETLIADLIVYDQQCSILTRYFCETCEELHQLLVNLLAIPTQTAISVTDSHSINVSFPIFFGQDNIRSKIWSFEIHLHEKSTKKTDVTLDPQDWTDIRALGHRMMDDMMNFIRNLRLRPTWQPMPLNIKQTIQNTKLPLEGQSSWKVYEEICQLFVPYPVGNIHPRYWGYVQGNGSPVGALAEFITASVNTMSWGGNQASIYLESQVLSWMKDLLGFPNDQTSSGVLVSGTSVATIIAMAVARRKFLNRKVKIYSSKEAHNCLLRAIDLLDMGRENMVLIPTNDALQIDIKVRKRFSLETDEDISSLTIGFGISSRS